MHCALASILQIYIGLFNFIQVLEMVIKWLKHKWHQRHLYAHNLLKRVRLGQIPEDILTRLLDDEILSVEGCRQLLDEVLAKQKSDLSKAERALLYPHLFATRSDLTVSSPPGYSVSTGHHRKGAFYIDP